MPLTVLCRACSVKLRVPDHLAGRKVKCPKCDALIPIAPPKPKPVPVVEEVPEVEPEPEQEEQEELPKKKKKKKKKARKSSSIPVWALWVGGLGWFFLVAIIATILAFRAGHGELILGYSIYFAVMLPISTVILVVSMLLSSQIAGGIDFGEVHTAIPKAVGLLLLVNLVGLIPYGGFLTILVWLFGLMWLFHLDLWESRLLFVINAFMNFWANMFVLGVIVAAAMRAGGGGDSDGFDFDGPPRSGRHSESSKQDKDLEKIEALGGEVEFDFDNPDVVARITLSNTQITDASMSLVKRFPRIQTLELANTQITDKALGELTDFPSLRLLNLSNTKVTDAGMKHLRGLGKLTLLNVSGTAVTDAGIQELRKTHPNLAVQK